MLALLTFTYLVLSSWVPKSLASYAERQLEKDTGGRATVTLEAEPFWKLLSGRFDRLTVTLRGVRYEGGRLRKVHLLWYDGRLDVGELEVGVIRVDRVGTLRTEVTLSAAQLARMVPKSFRPFRPHLAIAPGGLELTGQASILGMNLPISLTGELVPSPSGRALDFRPVRFAAGGSPLPLPPEMRVFSLGTLPIPEGIHLAFHAVHLGRESAVFVLTGS